AKLRVCAADVGVEATPPGHRSGRECVARTDDYGGRVGAGPRRVHAGGGGVAEAAPLPWREAPEAVVRPELTSVLGDNRAARGGQAVSLQEHSVVAAREEACLLAIGTAGDCEPGALCLGTRFLLRLVAEWKPEPVEEARIEPREHVRLVLVVVCRAREQKAVATAGDAGVGPGRG